MMPLRVEQCMNCTTVLGSLVPLEDRAFSSLATSQPSPQGPYLPAVPEGLALVSLQRGWPGWSSLRQDLQAVPRGRGPPRSLQSRWIQRTNRWGQVKVAGWEG